MGHGHHALHGAAQAAGTDDRPDRRQHRHPGRLPRRAPHLPRRGPQVLRAGRGLQHLHHAGGRLHVHLRVHRGGRRRLHGGVGRPHRGDVPPPGDHRPFPPGPVSGPDPRRAGHRHRHGGDRLHDRLRGVRVRRPDAAQLRRGDRAAGALASGLGQLGRRPRRQGDLQLQLQRAEHPAAERALRQRSDQRSPARCHHQDAEGRGHRPHQYIARRRFGRSPSPWPIRTTRTTAPPSWSPRPR